MTTTIDTTTGQQCGKPVHKAPKACYGDACPKRVQCNLYVILWPAPKGAIDSCQVGQTWPRFIKKVQHDA